jgi:transcriptional regulator with XRE-family HTH domain
VNEDQSARLAVQAFLREAIRRAGKAEAVAHALKGRVKSPPSDGHTVSAWVREANPNMPRADVIFALAGLYGISVDEFVLGESEQRALGDRVAKLEQQVHELQARLDAAGPRTEELRGALALVREIEARLDVLERAQESQATA